MPFKNTILLNLYRMDENSETFLRLREIILNFIYRVIICS